MAAPAGSLLTLNGTLDISQLTTGSFTLGAFAGTTGSVELGANRLVIESQTTPAHTLATVLDGGLAGGTGGSLQIGTGEGEAPAAGMDACLRRPDHPYPDRREHLHRQHGGLRPPDRGGRLHQRLQQRLS